MIYRLLALLSLPLALHAAPNPTARTNVILIMADDLGYADLSCYGSERLRTPVLDQLAKDGIRLTSFYAGATVCTPSRMALLTGSYPPRCGWAGGVVGYRIKGANGLAPEAVTIAEVFKAAGYRTGLIGKWHLGDSPEHSPMAQGFDYAYWIKKSNNQTKKLYRNEELIEDPFTNRMLSEQFTREAIAFIEPGSKPFFLYLPLTAPHFPAEAHPDWKGRSANEAYGDVVEELDHRIGEILAALKQHELEQNTLVMFLSDNGPEPGQKQWARATPYRGLKWSALEGGTRVPCIVRWPGTLPAGQVSDALSAAVDVLPTLAAACGIEPGDGMPKRDGVSLLSMLTGGDAPHPRRELLYWSGWAVPQAIRLDEWKLYVDRIKDVAGSGQGPALFNLSTDPGEENNLAAEYPGRVIAMRTLAITRFAEVQANRIPLGGPVDKKAATPKQAAWLHGP